MSTIETLGRTDVEPSADSRPPLLRRGDCLSLAEFERRYRAMPELKKAELIDGTVYLRDRDSDTSCGSTSSMASPVSFLSHAVPHNLLIHWLVTYQSATPGVASGGDCSVRLDPRNVLQPDGCLLILPEFDGQCRIAEDDFLEGAPEWVAEVSASSASRDATIKFDAYRKSGVREYLLWRTRDRSIDWFSLVGDDYVRLSSNDAGVIESGVFPGLRLDTKALIDRDIPSLLRSLSVGLDSPEHAAFVERLEFNRLRHTNPRNPEP